MSRVRPGVFLAPRRRYSSQFIDKKSTGNKIQGPYRSADGVKAAALRKAEVDNRKKRSLKKEKEEYHWTCDLSESYLYRLVREYRLFCDADGSIDGIGTFTIPGC